MCGLFGVISNTLIGKDFDVFTTGLYVTALRGMHSTGVLRLAEGTKKGSFRTHLVKEPMDSPGFISLVKEKHDNFFGRDHKEEDKVRALLGHCRHATIGAVNKKNSHPFVTKDIIGMHNGTLTYIPKEYGSQYETDSEAFFHMLQDLGTEEAIKKAHGAYAFVWFNKRDKTIHIIRNSQRTLFYMAHGNDFFYSSELGMLTFALDRNGRKGLIEHIKPVPINTEFTIPVGKDKEVQSFTTTPINPFLGSTTNTGRTSGTVSHVRSNQSNQTSNVVSIVPVYSECVIKGKTVKTKTVNGKTYYFDGFRYYSWENWKEKEDKKEQLLSVRDNAQRKAQKKRKNRSRKISGTDSAKVSRNVPKDYQGFVTNMFGETLYCTKSFDLRKEDAKEHLDVGCHWCDSIPDVDDWEKIAFLDDYSYVCHHCGGQEFIGETFWAKLGENK